MQLIQQSVTLPDSFSITPEAEEFRNTLALRAIEVKAITNSAEQNSAVEICRDVRTAVKALREVGMNFRRPFRAAQDRSKAAEDELITPLETEQARIEKLVTLFQQQEARRVAAEEAARQAELARLEAIRLEAEQAAQAAAANVTTEAELATAIEQERLAKATEQAWRDKVVAPLPTAQKAKGTSTRKVMDIQVTDLHALYKANPDLVRLDANLAAIRAICVPELPVPGLVLTWRLDTSTRAW